MMKYALYFIFSFSRYLDFCLEVLVKQLARLIHEVTICLTNNYKAHIAQYLTKLNQSMKTGQLIGYNKRNFFFKNHAEKEATRPVPEIFLFF